MIRTAVLIALLTGCAPQRPALPLELAPLPLIEAAATQDVLYVCDVQQPGLTGTSRLTISDENIAGLETWCAGFFEGGALQCHSRAQTRGAERFTSGQHSGQITITPDGAMTFGDAGDTPMTGTCERGQAV